MEKNAKEWKENLFIKRKNGALKLDESQMQEASDFGEDYKKFLDASKTEREAVEQTILLAQKAGFEEYKSGKSYHSGEKIYYVNRGKSIILAIIGKKPLQDGTRMVAAHLDSPRLDLKQNAIVEIDEQAFFKTHYYGGIKKYQWATIPLSLHGVIIKQNGEKIKICIGEQDGDPVFCMNDLLPHLAMEQMKRTASNVIRGEEMNVLIGSYPFRDDKESELVKLNILKILFEKYEIVERDFISAELELVPAFRTCDVGLDRSLVGGYGQDDRSCSYAAIQAILGMEAPLYTSIVVLADKEETGSDGNTGLHSSFLEYFVDDLAQTQGIKGRMVLSKSLCLSADVGAAFDPTFPKSHDKINAPFINHGGIITKYTGARGKSGSSDASAEFVNAVTRMLDRNHVLWQTGELGEVDAGGGGTVAMFLANLDMEVLDIGVPVLSMHAPFEVISKIDLYSIYRAYQMFFIEDSLER